MPKAATPAVFVNESKDGYEITFEIPGVDKEDVSLNIENRTLTLTAENGYAPPEGLACVSREFPVYNYAVSLDLPEHADTATVKATVANGILTTENDEQCEERAVGRGGAVALRLCQGILGRGA